MQVTPPEGWAKVEVRSRRRILSGGLGTRRRRLRLRAPTQQLTAQGHRAQERCMAGRGLRELSTLASTRLVVGSIQPGEYHLSSMTVKIDGCQEQRCF